ncbi:preprotein translocase subunit SecG [Riemerella columbipharyngis]|uniref:Protein-export membrane protein SecG n=1 Tax=Riemerella columbipharyngis TaxID=1071918 RepID=A0A1G6ZB88_9FLAO|nr:preprotein translocase subunit SecG [Riemerella columbipharyngis]SDD99135.1 preprotein translocase subunit SecG [Riemerella columbipharyngis]
MDTVFTLFMVLIVIACVLLVVIIMAQNPKGGGLSGTFGGASSASFGVQRTNDFMEKATWSLGITVVVLVILSIALTGKPIVNQVSSSKSQEQTQLPQAPQAPVQTPTQTPASSGK